MKSALPLRLFLLFVSITAAGGCAGGPKARGPAPDDGKAPRTYVYVGTAAGTIEGLSLEGGVATTGVISLTPRTRFSMGGAVAGLASLPFGKNLVALDDRTGSLAIHDIDVASGGLHAISRGSSGGAKAGRIILDRGGKYVLVTNQASASVAVLAVGPGGRLSPPDLFPAGAGAFGLALHPSNTVAFVANTKAGTLSQLTFNDGTGTLTTKLGAAIGLPWGSGPRLVVCHPRGRWVYVLNETNNSVSVHSFDDRMGTVSRLAFQVISTTPGEGAAEQQKGRVRELAVAPSGRFVYVLDGARDDVATYSVDEETGALTLVDHEPSGGSGAVALALDPGGRSLVIVHQGSRQVAAFRLDEKTGIPTLGDNTRLSGAPLSVAIVKPTGS
jgi:6-phosphogluconolactonase